MTLLTPLALGLLVLAGPIIVLYILRLRRPRHMVSSTLLWQRTLEDTQANAPWQRLRPNLLLLLQLIAVVLLVFTLAHPAYSRSGAYTGNLVVVVDQSFEMQATDVVPSRFAAAVARAHLLADGLTGSNVMSVIGMAAQPTLAIARSTDQSAIDQAINGLHVTMSPPDFPRTFSLAASLARGQNATVIILTSRNSGITGPSSQVDFPVRIERIGGRASDLGITTFQAERTRSHTQALARVSNFGPRTARSDLDLFVDGQLADVQPLEIAPGRQRTFTWSTLPPAAEIMRLHLSVHDDFGADKSAWSVIPAATTHRALLVSTPDYFLQTALRLDPAVRLSIIPPGSYRPALAHGFDLVVFNGFLPRSLPSAPTLIVDPSRGAAGSLRFGARVKLGSSPVTAVSPNPVPALLSYVDLSDVHVAVARRTVPPSWLQPVAMSNGIPLLAAGESADNRVAVLPFDLQQSDWPLRISFPIAIQNLIRYLVPPPTVSRPTIGVGQAVNVTVGSGVRAVDITRPNGKVERLHVPLTPFNATSQPGLYTVRAIGGRHPVAARFAANFLSPRPAPSLGPPVLLLGRGGAQSAAPISRPVQISWAFGLLVLAALCVEWWFALRR